MPLKIVPKMDISLADLANASRAGDYVLKTPHVGNMYANNLAVASLRIPIVLVDQTVGGRDRNFHPHRVIVGGRSEEIADPTRLTSRVRISVPSARVPGRFIPGASLLDAHVASLREAFPRTSIQTTSERMRAHHDVMLPLVETLSKRSSDAWKRFVASDGSVQERSAPSWSAVEMMGVLGLTSGDAGWLVPNAWHILSDAIIGAKLTGRAHVYSLSGPDMIRYAPALEHELSLAYDVLRMRTMPWLPETFELLMVPVADMRLVTTVARASALEAVVDAYLRLLALKRSNGTRMSGLTGPDKRAMIGRIEAERGACFEEIATALDGCPEVFYELADANWLTQYDLLAGETLFVHPWGVESPLADVEAAMRLFTRLRRPVPPSFSASAIG